MKQKAFFNTFKGFSLKQIRQKFFEGESLTLSIDVKTMHKIFTSNKSSPSSSPNTVFVKSL